MLSLEEKDRQRQQFAPVMLLLEEKDCQQELKKGKIIIFAGNDNGYPYPLKL